MFEKLFITEETSALVGKGGAPDKEVDAEISLTDASALDFLERQASQSFSFKFHLTYIAGKCQEQICRRAIMPPFAKRDVAYSKELLIL